MDFGTSRGFNFIIVVCLVGGRVITAYCYFEETIGVLIFLNSDFFLDFILMFSIVQILKLSLITPFISSNYHFNHLGNTPKYIMNKRFLQISLFLILLCTFGECALKHRYHTNNEMLSIMAELSSKYPEISRIYSIGKSVQGTELRVIEISDNPGFHDPLEPEVKYVGNIHGNEVVGRQILLHLVEYLLSSYGKNDTITRLINNTRIHILVCMNPDGYARGRDQYGRYNYNGVDLNRNFKDPFDNRYEQIQQETLAITQWLKDYPFMLSAGLHGGSLVVNYPYDNLPRSERSRYVYKYSPSPDDDVFM